MFNILKTHSIFIRFMICNYVFFILFSIIAHIYWNILHTDHNLPVANINTQYLHERTSRMKDPEFRSYPYATHEKSSTKFSCFYLYLQNENLCVFVYLWFAKSGINFQYLHLHNYLPTCLDMLIKLNCCQKYSTVNTKTDWHMLILLW